MLIDLSRFRYRLGGYAMQSQQQLRTGPWRLMGLAATFVAASVMTAGADSWNDKTILKFSAPVMVPGATLQPGSYVFKLMDSKSSRHTVQISTEDGARVVALTQAVPMKRTDSKGDVVLKFNPTDTGSPPAIKGWYYPGSLYGHEFVYPEEQAKQIAQRTKTIVLSTDVPGNDLEKGTLRTYDAAGSRSEWSGDATTLKEWEEWQRNRRATATVATPQGSRSEEAREATAPMVSGDFQGMRVKLDDLEDNPKKYIGQTISVDAEVEDVFGPRVFTIDEANWGDLEGETLVYMATDLAALVQEDDRVTITGTVKPFMRAEVEREWGWLGLQQEVEIDLAKKPVLVATRIVGGTDNAAMVIKLGPPVATAVGTSGIGASTALSDLAAIARGTDDLVGRHVNLTGVKVNKIAKDGGFFATTTAGTLFVLPSSGDKTGVQVGDTVSVKGVVLQLPSGMRESLNAAAGVKELNDDIYVYATSVAK